MSAPRVSSLKSRNGLLAPPARAPATTPPKSMSPERRDSCARMSEASMAEAKAARPAAAAMRNIEVLLEVAAIPEAGSPSVPGAITGGRTAVGRVAESREVVRGVYGRPTAPIPRTLLSCRTGQDRDKRWADRVGGTPGAVGGGSMRLVRVAMMSCASIVPLS